jgi:hypothetical protein
MDQPLDDRGEQRADQSEETPPQAVDVVISDVVAPQTGDGAIAAEVPAPAVDRVISGVPAAIPRHLVTVPAAEAAEYPIPAAPERDRVRWGPVVAGSVVSLGALILLNAFGIAVGASALKPGVDLANWWNWPGVYGGASLIVSLFLGGWVAARAAAAPVPYAGAMHGLLVGVATVAVVGLTSLLGIGNLLGFLGANLAFISDFNPAGTNATTVYDTIKHGSWGTLIFIAAGFIAAAIGGLLASLRNKSTYNRASASGSPELRPARA